MVDDFLIADMDLASFDERRYGNHHGKLFRIAFEVVNHGDDCFIVLANQDNLRRLVKNLRIGFRDVETAEAIYELSLGRQNEEQGQE